MGPAAPASLSLPALRGRAIAYGAADEVRRRFRIRKAAITQFSNLGRLLWIPIRIQRGARQVKCDSPAASGEWLKRRGTPLDGPSPAGARREEICDRSCRRLAVDAAVPPRLFP